MKNESINTSDIPEITDFSKARPNPYAEKIRKHGYSITIHYSPEDVARMTKKSIDSLKGLDMLELDPDEREALRKYEEAHKGYTD